MPMPTQMTVIMVFTIMAQPDGPVFCLCKAPVSREGSAAVGQEEGLGGIMEGGTGKAPF